ncbi:MAG: hypothetical protein PHV90_00300 [Smithella sp.]|jgi:hypothetical protein|nr:hypothetical protein [Smithella sp.]
MNGLISTGEDYKNKALSGFIRESADEQKRSQANKDLAARQQEQTISMAASGVGTAVSIGLMLACL